MALIQRLASLNSRLTSISTRLGLASTTLTFEVNNGALQVDPETGLEYLATSQLVIEVFLKQSTSQYQLLQNQEAPWNEPSVLKVEGHLINPTLLPNTIRSGMTAAAHINSDSPIEGRFLLLPSLQNESIIQGHNIRGLLLLSPGAA